MSSLGIRPGPVHPLALEGLLVEVFCPSPGQRLDREFHTDVVLAWLTGKGRTFVVHFRLGPRERERWEHVQQSHAGEHTLNDSSRKGPPLRLWIHVVVRYQEGERFARNGGRDLIYAALGHVALDALHAVPVRRTHGPYRRRPGIESSYRIAHRAPPRTCARSVPWRLRFLGVGLLC